MYLFEKRLGCLSDDNKESEEYIAAVQDVMQITSKHRTPLEIQAQEAISISEF